MLPTRREFLASTLSTTGLLAAGAQRVRAADPPADKALIAITLDLEMSRNFPAWDDTHWDFEKGNLDQDTKRYAVEAARRVKAKGGRIHFFALGQTFEQENVDWLREIIAQGHPVGNHTYDHVYVLATKPEDIQFRFKRAPWLIEGKSPAEVIAANIRMASEAMKQRVGIEPAGFRTPGGFSNGISDRPDVQELLLKLGYRWVSSRYPAHPASPPGQSPTSEVIKGVVAAQAQAQPFVYPSGLIEVPMSPVSDINAFRTGRWPLEAFMETIRAGVSWAIENQATFDFLAHPSCLGVVDPKFRTIEMICEMVEKAGPRAILTDLGTIAQRAKANAGR
ncbi:polysaccharide deacetylase family protein [Singulisphaera sp. Ch08]|uniref:Polysaccharide deacetylase family protein n=1 Tax=Singulisphaera sp. Ch08 TaxID=3120278 RepID=A0AAU7C876_9BACT